MDAPEIPAGVVEDLRAIRGTFVLRWNPRGAVERPGEIQADGSVSPPLYGGRWELWDTDAEGAEYRVLTVRDDDGGYRPLDRRVVERMRLVDPARYGGDVQKMLLAVMDDPNAEITRGDEESFHELIEAASRWYWDYGKPKVSVTQQIQ